MTTVFGAPTRPATTSLGSATTQRRLLAATFGVVATLLSLSCSDDAPNESTNSLFPDAAADAEATITNPGTTDAGAEELVTSSHQNDTNTSEITTIGEHTGTGALETADGTEDSAQVACTPVACTCPDPTSPDCCPEALPYRRAVIEASAMVDAGAPSADGEGTSETPLYPVTRDAVWRKFERNCGGVSCHGGADNPTDPVLFKFTQRSFAQRTGFGDECLDRVKAPAERVMPPGTGDGTKRQCPDQYVRLCEEIKALEAATWPESGNVLVEGCPEEDTGGPGPAVGCGVSAHPYAVADTLAQAQTNIGSCIPSPRTPTCAEADLLSKDKQFETYETSDDLPKMLWDTDMVSLDSEVLAAHRVYSYAPTYTLFSDNAKKQRYVRVPVGKAIIYNKETQDFDIPDNTRFYKTFLRQVIDKDGNVGYRKMETRLIVVRTDDEFAPGKFRVRALRATYAWSDDEQKATLLDANTDPMRNGEPWLDRLCPVVVDERTARDPLKNPISPLRSDVCEYMTESEVADSSSGLVRHYAIPGSTRCDECHMGSNNHSYILGFNPWQADRRPADQGGVYDPVHPDELTQLRRFIDYGVIRGIRPGQAKLEKSQGERQPRNEYELTAQGYMLGNCAYCHSPHGFPTVENPVLASLDFYPKQGESGGIYQFPLDKESPRVRLGPDGQGRMKYISAATTRNDRQPFRLLGSFDVLSQVPDAAQGPDWTTQFGLSVFGPVDSLIWRNVYTPFTYADTYIDSIHQSPENAIFIHMPRNVAGFDCRAHKIMANWMLSIPSDDGGDGVVEVQPEEASYGRALGLAKRRVVDYHLTVTGQHCPTDDDIVDPSVLTSPTIPGTDRPRKPAPGPDTEGGVEARMNGPRLADGEDGPNSQRLIDGIPGHAHWVTVDLNEPKGQWYPRRVDWKSYLAGSPEQRTELIYNQGGLTEQQQEKMSRVLPHLDTVFVTEAQREYSLAPTPLGLWSSQCSALAAQRGAPMVGDLHSAEASVVSRWIFDGPFADGKLQLPPDRYVHSMSPGQAVFESICMNCHGTQLDSNSPLAKTVAEVTGGRSRVANFRDGMLGPVQNPGAYSTSVFTFSEGNTGASAADWQARYLLWMGLGGTLAEVPKSVISLISTTPFYGRSVSLAGGAQDANMLEPAAATCRALAASVIHVTNRLDAEGLLTEGLSLKANGSGFAVDTGHYQLWESLCNFAQQPLIRVTWMKEHAGQKTLTSGPGTTDSVVFFSRDRTGRSTYGSNWVGDARGNLVMGIQADNPLPWCVVRPGSVRPPSSGNEKFTEDEYVEWFTRAGLPADQIPWCPDTLFAQAFGQYLNEFPANDADVDALDDTDARDWWYRQGAINAGLAALYYMEGVTQGVVTPELPYNSDQCVRSPKTQP